MIQYRKFVMAQVQVQSVTRPGHINGGFVISTVYLFTDSILAEFVLFWPNLHVLAEIMMHLSLLVLACITMS